MAGMIKHPLFDHRYHLSRRSTVIWITVWLTRAEVCEAPT
jgi:hypothetical protein